MNIDKKILEIYDEINKSQKSILQTIGIKEALLDAPLDTIKVNSPFGPRWGRQHNGVDFAADAANVKSPADGVVSYIAADEYPCGGTIKIDHPDGYTSGYCHMQKINVRSGQKVMKGDIIGISGGGSNDPGKGRSDGRHLHFTLKKDGQTVDPMGYIGKEGIVSSDSGSTSTNSSSQSSEDAYNYATSASTPKPSTGGYAKVVGDIKSIQGMSEEVDEILEIYESILSKNLLKEVSSASSDLFGGSNVKIPVDGAHAGQSGWQSSNAWDIAAPVGTPVYALADGVAQTFSDYGKTVTATQNKKLYGQSFTVKSDGGLPGIYYTHLEGSPVTKGATIKCGQFLGSIMDFPNSNYDHVHIGVETGNIRQFLNDDGTIKCAKGQKISGSELSSNPTSDSTSDSASEDAYNYATSNSTASTNTGGYAKVVGTIKSIEGLSEQRNFGKNISNRYGRVIIPKDDNPKIKSPISGNINNKKYFASCKNQVTIENIDNGTIYLQFCGISNPSSFRNGESVRNGTLLGTTDTDVEVIMYDDNWNRISIPEKDLSISPKEKVKDLEDTKRKSAEPEYYDPIMAALMGLPSKIFQDKFDKSGNRTEKRYGGVADKKEVDPFVLNFLKDPFKRKKVNEDIEKIKKML